MLNTQPASTVKTDWDRDFLSDHAHQFLQVEIANGAQLPGEQDNLLVSRCTAHLMAVCRCSQATAETRAAQAVAELASRHINVRFDMDRSTAYALFVQDSQGQTRVISAETLNRLMMVDLLLNRAGRVTH